MQNVLATTEGLYNPYTGIFYPKNAVQLQEAISTLKWSDEDRLTLVKATVDWNDGPLDDEIGYLLAGWSAEITGPKHLNIQVWEDEFWESQRIDSSSEEELDRRWKDLVDGGCEVTPTNPIILSGFASYDDVHDVLQSAGIERIEVASAR